MNRPDLFNPQRRMFDTICWRWKHWNSSQNNWLWSETVDLSRQDMIRNICEKTIRCHGSTNAPFGPRRTFWSSLEAGTRKRRKYSHGCSKQIPNCTPKIFWHKFAFVIAFRAIHLVYYAVFYWLLQALYPITVSNRRMPSARPHHLNSWQCFVRAIPS